MKTLFTILFFIVVILACIGLYQAVKDARTSVPAQDTLSAPLIDTTIKPVGDTAGIKQL